MIAIVTTTLVFLAKNLGSQPSSAMPMIMKGIPLIPPSSAVLSEHCTAHDEEDEERTGQNQRGHIAQVLAGNLAVGGDTGGHIAQQEVDACHQDRGDEEGLGDILLGVSGNGLHIQNVGAPLQVKLIRATAVRKLMPPLMK